MAGGTSIPVLIGVKDGRVLIRPVGPCTLVACDLLGPTLEGFHKPDTTDVYFDLSQAETIDSTFTGMLLGLLTGRKGPATPAVHLIRPTPRVVDALEQMHVLRLFDVCDSMPGTPDELNPLTTRPGDLAKLRDLVIDAHKDLIEADPRNAATFGRVVSGLENERRDRPVNP